jgi:hypothetical protein
MGIARGFSTVKSVYRESSWGVAATAYNAYGINIQSIASAVSQNMIDDPTMGSNRKRYRAIHGNIDAGFTITITVNPEQIAFWLNMAFGAATTTGSSAPYTHTFEPKTLPSFTLEEDFSADIAATVVRYSGCRVASGSVTIPQEGPVTMTLQCLAKNISVNAAALDATPTVPNHRPWSARESSIMIEGVRDCRIKAYTLNFNNEMESIYTLGCDTQTYGERGDLTEGRCVVNGTLDMVFSNADTMSTALSRTDQGVYAYMQFGTGDGSAEEKEKLSFHTPQVDFGLHAPSVETRAGLSVQVPFEAYATSSAYSLTAALLSPRTAATLYLT